MKRLFAFLLTTLLLLSMAAVTVQADEAAPSYSIKLSRTGGAAGEDVTVEYTLVCSDVKSIMIQPEVPEGFTLVKDEWKIKGMIAEPYVSKDDDGNVVYGDPATFTAVSSFNANGVIYTATYEVKEGTANGNYPIGFDMLRIKVMPKGGEETWLYVHDVTSETPVDEGTDNLTVEDGNIHVHQHSDDCMTWVEESDSTCITYGCKKAHWECSESHQAFEGEHVPGGYNLEKEMKVNTYRKPLSTHTFEDEANYISARKATCTEDGYKYDYQLCDVCGDKFDENFTEISEADFGEKYLIPATGHKWGNWEVTKEATCTEAGSQKRTCANGCGTVETEEIPMLDHTLEHHEAIEANCEHAGNMEYWQCSVCKKNFSDEKGTTEIEDDVTIPVQDHDYDWENVKYDWSEDHKSCTATTVCKTNSEHKFTEDATVTVEEIAATCTEKGGLSSVAVFKDEHLETKTYTADPTPALGHVFTHFEATDETCEKEGNVEYWHCSRCNLNFSNDEEYSTAKIEDTVIPALGHDWGEWEETPATCTEAGNRSRVCKRDGTHIETETIAALGHDFENGTVTYDPEPTCTEAGKKTTKCARCDETLTEDVPALGHDFEHGTVTYDPEPTCTEAGKKITKCARCDETKTEEEPARGHKWGAWVVTKQPTTEETGLQVRTCSVCGEKETQELEKLPVKSSLPSGFEQAMAYYRNQQKLKKAAEEAAAKKAAEEAAKKAAEEAAKAAETPAIADTWTNPFVDVFETDAYYDAVRYVYESELFKGVSETEFAPHVTMNRAMFVTVLGRLAGVDPAAYATTSFTDVDPIGTWNYAPYVEWAAQNGIVLGYGNGKFGPQDEITVEQAAVIIARYAKYIGLDTASGADLAAFTDGEAVSEWAADALAWAVDNGIYTGVGGALNPQSSAERALVATMLYNFANVCEK